MAFKKRKSEHEIDEEEEFDEEEEEEYVEEDEEEEETHIPLPKPKKKNKKKAKAKPGFAMFNIPNRMGIVNTETNEVVAGAENINDATLQVLADLKAQLERIEDMIGSIIDE